MDSKTYNYIVMIDHKKRSMQGKVKC